MTYDIRRLGHLGDGIADGPVYVPRTLPGEVVNGVLDGQQLNEVKIVTPSENRVKPPCSAYNRCGGCAVQHAADGFVAEWKQGIVRQALAAHDLDAPLRNMTNSAPNTRRRAKLGGRRTKKGALVGFYGRGSDALQDISGCTVLDPAITDLIPALTSFTQEFGSRKGTLEFWVLKTDNGLDVTVQGVTFDVAKSASYGTWMQGAGLARLTIGDELVGQAHPPKLRFGKVDVTPPPMAFTQATPEGEVALQKAVLEITAGAKNVIDLFAGCGTLGLPVAETSPVWAVEGDQALLDALDHGIRFAKGLKAVTISRRDLFRNPVLAEDLVKFDAAIVDPPRAGAEAQVHELAQGNVAKIAMVSCNPTTFARDVATLCRGGFELDWIDVVDQFRWSPHIEVAAQLTKR